MSIPNYQDAANTANGEVLRVGEDEWVKIYNHSTTTALTVGYGYAISTKVDATDTTAPIFYRIPVAPVTAGTAHVEIGVAETAIAALAHGFLKTKGKVEAYVNGTTYDVAYGDTLGLVTAGTAFVRVIAATEGVSVQPTITASAIALEAVTADAATLVSIVLLGGQRGIPAATA
ncbi:MAG: hypothetical protein IMZ53_04935 [Thermoplasmata archaeon]|nr:hypothetical protein [Thermoplasmata archaeon]